MASTTEFEQQQAQDGSAEDDDDEKKKDKKLVFLSRSVLQKVRERPMVTGTQIANEILEMYKKFCDVSTYCGLIVGVFSLGSLVTRLIKGGGLLILCWPEIQYRRFDINHQGIALFCQIGQKVDFKNVQRRVYDALNVLSAMDIIRKDKYNIIYNHYNKHIPENYGLDDSEEAADQRESFQDQKHVRDRQS